MIDFEEMKSNMVKGQLLPSGITNSKLLRAFKEVPRHHFVDPKDQAIAYSDQSLHLNSNRFLLKPLVVGLLLQESKLRPSDKILNVGATTGYTAALLSYMARTVVAVEENDFLFERLLKNTSEGEYYSVMPLHRDLRKGAEEEAPFDVILIEGEADDLPLALFNQLKDDGKLMVFQETSAPGLSQCVCHQKNRSAPRLLFQCEAKSLPAFKQVTQEFQF
jgi:protein-L-isoaspartate(D-aspartate) O-methyltransferase